MSKKKRRNNKDIIYDARSDNSMYYDCVDDDEYIDRLIEKRRKSFYKEWEEYLSEYE